MRPKFMTYYFKDSKDIGLIREEISPLMAALEVFKKSPASDEREFCLRAVRASQLWVFSGDYGPVELASTRIYKARLGKNVLREIAACITQGVVWSPLPGFVEGTLEKIRTQHTDGLLFNFIAYPLEENNEPLAQWVGSLIRLPYFFLLRLTDKERTTLKGIDSVSRLLHVSGIPAKELNSPSPEEADYVIVFPYNIPHLFMTEAQAERINKLLKKDGFIFIPITDGEYLILNPFNPPAVAAFRNVFDLPFKNLFSGFDGPSTFLVDNPKHMWLWDIYRTSTTPLEQVFAFRFIPKDIAPEVIRALESLKDAAIPHKFFSTCNGFCFSLNKLCGLTATEKADGKGLYIKMLYPFGAIEEEVSYSTWERLMDEIEII